MEREKSMSLTLELLLYVVEVAAAIRCAFATYTVVLEVTQDQTYTIFTVLVVEGLFLASLFMIGRQAIAPISALIALAFSATMQYLELLVVDGVLTDSDRVILRAVIAFAPIVILGLAYLRRLAVNTSVESVRGGASDFLERLRGRGRSGLTPSESAIKNISGVAGGPTGVRSLNMSGPKSVKMKMAKRGK